MGKLALAAKITHVPSMYLTRARRPAQGLPRRRRSTATRRSAAAAASSASTPSSCSTCTGSSTASTTSTARRQFEGIYTSNELPHFIKNMPYEYPGNPALGHLIADVANATGVKSRAHSDTTLELEYGTLVPMRYMNADQHFKVVSVSGWCMWHDLHESRPLRPRGAPRHRGALRRHGGGVRQRIAVAPLRRQRHARRSSCTRSRTRSSSRSTGAWSSCGRRGDWKTFVGMLPMYADKCWGEGGMHDTAMLLGATGLGPLRRAGVEIITPYFGSSGTGQINAIFPVTPP